LPIWSQTLGAGEAAVIVRSRGRPPLVVTGPASVRVFGRWKQMIFVDLRARTFDFSTTDALTQDGVRLTIRGSVDAQVLSPVDAATKVVDYRKATCLIAETALRGSLPSWLASDVAERGADLERELLEQVRPIVREWGVLVSAVRVDRAA
jgi:SPFH domain / Band 7 family